MSYQMHPQVFICIKHSKYCCEKIENIFFAADPDIEELYAEGEAEVQDGGELQEIYEECDGPQQSPMNSRFAM